jgi:ribosomal protein S18 acetylase RimI-like enzyme
MSEVQLTPFADPDAFSAYLQRNLSRFAIDKATVEGTTVAEALDAARKQIASLLPQGPETPGHIVRRIEVAGVGLVGEVWWYVNTDRNEGFLYDIYIEPQFRRHGYGRAALLLVEAQLREVGVRQIWMNVFALNHEALKFYHRLGYQVSTMHLSKLLSTPE